MRQIIIPNNYKYIAVFLSMRCNLNCSFCLNAFSNSNKKFNRLKFKEISGQEWINSINRMDSGDDVPITLSGGEPSLHPDFFFIINNLKPQLKIDLLTNLCWPDRFIKKFISEVNPNRLKRNAPYPSIRVSYHPEQMGNGERIIQNIKALQNAGFNIGVESVMYPDPHQIEAIEQMAIECRNNEISFRPKSYTGKFDGVDNHGRVFSIIHGNYSKYPGCSFQEFTKTCLCKTTELLIGPDGRVYRCHRDLLNEEFSVGNITHPDFEIYDDFKPCNKFGQCHPCDVKLKSNYKQELGHTSVEIKDIQ